MTQLKETLRQNQTHLQQTKELNYKKFSQQPEYRNVNHWLLARAFVKYLPNQFTFVDVASGTGLVSQELFDFCIANNKIGHIIGVEPDHFAIETAIEDTPDSPICTTDFIEGYGQNLVELLKGKIPKEGVHGVSILDALHEIPGNENKEAVLRAMAVILKPGGTEVFNSAFTSKANTFGWGKWRLDVLRSAGLSATNKELENLTPEYYHDLIENVQGFTVVHEQFVTVPLSRDALIAISEYPRFIQGMFDGVYGEDQFSLEEKGRLLKGSLERRNVQRMDRVWYEIMAKKAA